MKIYLAIKYHSDNLNRHLIESLTQHLQAQGHRVICAVSDFESWGSKSFDPKELLLKAFDAIKESDLVLVEATEKGMGVGIEAGYAFAQRIPIVTIAKTGSDLSTNLKNLSHRVQLYNEVAEITVLH